MSSTLHPYDSNPTRPYGILPDPTPQVDDRPPLPIISVERGEKLQLTDVRAVMWLEEGKTVQPLHWMRNGHRAADSGHLICAAYLLAYIGELRRRTANEWMDKNAELEAEQRTSALLRKDRANLETKVSELRKELRDCR